MRKKPKSRNTFGPTIARDCPKCENKEMAFVAVQTRSIDEGQTIFYTCTKCQYVSIYSNYYKYIAMFLLSKL